ncbi:BirA family transcriptional regulator, biotin operon repressor / biotin-[acetyl-CoA-carboxylase] ligase [Corynebacterium mycetoides]|uniref:biotin--[biotin carboxyl-carrier protein] ligase n=1 Tax=Corynebacterium mycetoides TaxID=38302 RepID=A0A1G9QR53_9CORY|nr:biotin--[acetyl-CoA-carboxylase] ligase [Corynebacterium mycetoides]SDM13512.1 BirA family transcriptional regulator, biotin operon repressor / biotin-[acetyl-CoA-carboxylase] ligase [Corynebacterium mycetoides]
MTVKDIQRIAAEVVDSWLDVSWVESVGSTNTELMATGAPGSVLIADEQTAGKGRMGREWVSPKGSALALSALVDAPADTNLALASLAAGLAITDIIPSAELKWPNDALLGGKKFAGILSEADLSGETPRVVVGIGINAAWRAEDLPVEGATSLNLEGIDIDFDEFTIDLLRALAIRLGQWRDGAPELLEDYRAVCSTIGREVRLERQDGAVEGTVEGVNDAGEIIIDGAAYSAGDVTHLRPTN